MCPLKVELYIWLQPKLHRYVYGNRYGYHKSLENQDMVQLGYGKYIYIDLYLYLYIYAKKTMRHTNFIISFLNFKFGNKDKKRAISLRGGPNPSIYNLIWRKLGLAFYFFIFILFFRSQIEMLAESMDIHLAQNRNCWLKWLTQHLKNLKHCWNISASFYTMFHFWNVEMHFWHLEGGVSGIIGQSSTKLMTIIWELDYINYVGRLCTDSV